MFLKFRVFLFLLLHYLISVLGRVESYQTDLRYFVGLWIISLKSAFDNRWSYHARLILWGFLPGEKVAVENFCISVSTGIERGKPLPSLWASLRRGFDAPIIPIALKVLDLAVLLSTTHLHSKLHLLLKHSCRGSFTSSTWPYKEMVPLRPIFRCLQRTWHIIPRITFALSLDLQASLAIQSTHEKSLALSRHSLIVKWIKEVWTSEAWNATWRSLFRNSKTVSSKYVFPSTFKMAFNAKILAIGNIFNR